MSKKSSFLNEEKQDFLRFPQGINSTVAIGFVLLLGITLRFYNLGTESYWVDEIYTIIEGQQSIPQMIASGRLDQPPGYYIPFHYWIQIFGTTEISTRSFSALIGTAAIILICLIGREVFSKEVGIFGAFLMAISGFQIYYSQITRFYIFFELMVLFSYLFFILALRSKKIIHFALYGIASIFMVYSLVFGVAILAAQNLFFFLQARKYGNIMVVWLICQTLILLALAPYFYPLIFSESGMKGAVILNIGSIPAPSLLDPLRSVVHFILLARGERSWGIMLVNYAVAGAVLVTGTWVYANRQGKHNWVSAGRSLVSNLQYLPGITSKLLLICCWLLCPILLLFIFSVAIHPMYKDYYTISAAPALYLLLALGIYNARKVIPLIISLGTLAILILPSLGYYYTADIHQQWKETAAYVEEYSSQDDVIVFAGGVGTGIEQKSFDWYYRGTQPNCNLSNDLVDPNMKFEALMKCVSGNNRFWVLIRNSTEPSNSANSYRTFFADPNQTTMRLIKSRQFVDISIYLFELKK